MKKMTIYDPAMCCSTGVCGPSVNPELLRVATVLKNLKSHGIFVERYNLSSNPKAFIDNSVVNNLINTEGVNVLPIVMINGTVVKTKGYPTNEEFCTWLEIPESYLKSKIQLKSKSNGCGCNGTCC